MPFFHSEGNLPLFRHVLKIVFAEWPKKSAYFVFHPKVFVLHFFPYFLAGVDSRPGRFFWHLDPSGRYTTQQPIKIIETYFTVKSVLLTQRQCKKDFGRNNVPDGRTIQRMVAKFRNSQRKWGRCSQRPRSFIVRHNSWGFQNLRERREDFPRKSTRHLSQLAFREHQFLGSSMMILISFLTKFRSCRGKLIKVKQNEKHFVKISVKGLKMTLACWIWTIWTIMTTVVFVGDLLHFLTP